MNLDHAEVKLCWNKAELDQPVDAPLSSPPPANLLPFTEGQQKIIDVAQAYFDADMQTPDDALLEFSGDRNQFIVGDRSSVDASGVEEIKFNYHLGDVSFDILSEDPLLMQQIESLPKPPSYAERSEVLDNVYALSPKDDDSKDLLIDKYHALETLQEEYALYAIEKHSSLPVPDYAPVKDEFTYEYFEPVRTKVEYANTLLDFEAPTPVRDATLAWSNIANTDLTAALEEVESGPYRKVQEEVLIALSFDKETLAKGRSYEEAVETDRGRLISYQQAKDAAFSDDLIYQTQARSPLLYKYLKQIQDGIKGALSAKFEEDWHAAMRHDVSRDLGLKGLIDYLRENPHHIENLLSKAEDHAFHGMLDTKGMLLSLDDSQISEEDRASGILDLERDYEREYGPVKGWDVDKQGPIIEWARARLEGKNIPYSGNQEIEMYGHFNDDLNWGFTINLPDYAEIGEGGPIFNVENGKVSLDNMTRSPMLMERLETLQGEFPAPGQGQAIAR